MFNPNRCRQNTQTRDNILQYAGQTATWRQWVSASTGNPMAGFGAIQYYRQQTITALFNAGMVGTNTQQQFAGGQFPSGMLQMTTREKMSNLDEILYNGFRYRVDTDGQPSVMNGFYMTMIKRGLTGT